MKYLLGILVCAAILPAAKATPDRVVVNGERPPRWLVRTEIVGEGRNQATYYYTNIILTGSHVPAVIRRSRGKLELIAGASINGKAYSIGDTASTGANSVAGELAGLEPAISVH